MLSINNLSIQYGDKHLFKDISARVHPGERIGLAGVNGAGKSSLLKIMAGVTAVDDGVVQRGKYTTVGYLPQEVSSFPQDTTLYQEAETAFAEALALQDELDDVNRQLASAKAGTEKCEMLLARQGDLQHLLEHTDIFRMQSQIEKILTGLGFKESDFSRSCRSFSGGWLMRLMLAKLLLATPTLLLLDEPTNHLDIESLTWLEEFLKAYDGAMVIVSHDRAFLDNLTTTTWELSIGNLTVYKGNYSKYLTEKENRMQIQRAAYENQQLKIQQTMRFVEKFRAKSAKASQVQSRLKQLEKMEKIELDETEKQIVFRFPPAPPSGRVAFEVEVLSKSYDAPVFHDLSFLLQRGDKMAVVGVNGAGKSTLARMIAGHIQPDQGSVRLGHNIKLSYFGQHQAQELDQRYTVLDTLLQVESGLTITQVRSLLGAFLFRGDEVDKKVAVLSGGEKSRLALAKMIASPANLLIMDEPTNHLDMTSQEILQEAMKQYDGTIVVVSHNRYFLNSFVNRVLEIKNGVGTLYEGNVDDYLAKIKEEQKEEVKLSGQSAAQGDLQIQTMKKGKEARKVLAKIRQEKSQLSSPYKKIVAQSEKEIERLETCKKELEQTLADPMLYQDQSAFVQKTKEYQEIDRKLEREYRQWEKAQAKIDEIEASYANDIESASP